MFPQKSLIYLSICLAIFIGSSKSDVPTGVIANAFQSSQHLYKTNLKSDQDTFLKPYLIRFEDHRMMLQYGSTTGLVSGVKDTLVSQLDGMILDSWLLNLFGKKTVDITNNKFDANLISENSYRMQYSKVGKDEVAIVFAMNQLTVSKETSSNDTKKYALYARRCSGSNNQPNLICKDSHSIVSFEKPYYGNFGVKGLQNGCSIILWDNSNDMNTNESSTAQEEQNIDFQFIVMQDSKQLSLSAPIFESNQQPNRKLLPNQKQIIQNKKPILLTFKTGNIVIAWEYCEILDGKKNCSFYMKKYTSKLDTKNKKLTLTGTTPKNILIKSKNELNFNDKLDNLIILDDTAEKFIVSYCNVSVAYNICSYKVYDKNLHQIGDKFLMNGENPQILPTGLGGFLALQYVPGTSSNGVPATAATTLFGQLYDANIKPKLGQFDIYTRSTYKYYSCAILEKARNANQKLFFVAFQDLVTNEPIGQFFDLDSGATSGSHFPLTGLDGFEGNKLKGEAFPITFKISDSQFGMIWSYKDSNGPDNTQWTISGQVLEAGHYQNVITYGGIVLSLFIMIFTLVCVVIIQYFISNTMAKKRQEALKMEEKADENTENQDDPNKKLETENEMTDSTFLKGTAVTNTNPLTSQFSGITRKTKDPSVSKEQDNYFDKLIEESKPPALSLGQQLLGGRNKDDTTVPLKDNEK